MGYSTWGLKESDTTEHACTHAIGSTIIHSHITCPGGSDGKESAFNAVDQGLIRGFGRFPGGGLGNPFQYSCLENTLDRGAIVHGSQRVGHS